MTRIGIDLGGTKIEVVALSEDEDGEKELLRERIPTEQEKGYEHITRRIFDLYKLAVDKTAAAAEHTFGICTPGSISKQTGLLKNSNTVCLNGKPLKADIEKMAGREVILENDANCFALAEAMRGAGRGYGCVFGVIMGSGCGGGLVFDGQIHEGLMGSAGEWGHAVLNPAGPECYCGARGCVETYISGGGLERMWKARHGEAKKLAVIVETSRSGESPEREFIGEFLDHFALAMRNLIAVLDPDAIVLGGGLSKIDELYAAGYKRLKHNFFGDVLETPILRNKLGDSAGVIGAALIGR